VQRSPGVRALLPARAGLQDVGLHVLAPGTFGCSCRGEVTVETEWLVVGAGSAGCVIAGRLSEDREREVLVLEAGPDCRAADAPSELRSLNFWRALDADACGHLMWEGLLPRRTARQQMRPHLRGGGTGGSSAINGMIAIRAMPDDDDRWAAGGCPGWSYVDMLPYLRRMEQDLDFGDRPHHGDAGPIPVMRQDPAAWGAVDLGLADAAAALGHPWADDHDAPGRAGCHRSRSTSAVTCAGCPRTMGTSNRTGHDRTCGSSARRRSIGC
jgi:5-(hydroxymethyl)furfural/furfural oxidase